MNLAGFEKYCKENSDAISPTDNAQHNSLVNSLAKDPQRFGIRDVRAAYREVALIEDEIMVGCIDVVLFSEDIYVCEVKATDKHNAGSSQLSNAYEYIRDKFGVLTFCISARKRSDGRIITTKTPPKILDVIAQEGIKV
jgi:hypothetical protein